MVSFDVVEHFFIFLVFCQKRAFVKTSCSPGYPPSDLQNVKNSEAPPTTVMSSNMGSKPTDLIRDDNIQSTATP